MEEICSVNDNSLESILNINFSISKYKELTEEYTNNPYEKIGICLIDIKSFKLYNNVFGYNVGDSILYNIYSNFESYIKNKGKVFRFGSDVLLVIIHGIISKYQAEILIKDMINEFNKIYKILNNKVRIKFNIGAAIYPDDSSDFEILLKYAEIALGYSKGGSKDFYNFFDINLHNNLIEKNKFEVDIFNGLYGNELNLQFQPLVDLTTNKIYGLEALIRWNHPQYGLIPPSSFIDIIENNGMIVEVGKWVLIEACKQISRLEKMGFNTLSIAVNISEKQLEDESFFEFVEGILRETRIDPTHLHLEITERIPLMDKENVANNIRKLDVLGVKILLDDFGSFYSSLCYLHTLPIKGIKIDKSFISNIDTDKKKYIITKHIIELAEELGIEVVAEGVEAMEELNCLKALRCTKIQGYIFGKPENFQGIIKMLEKYNKQ